MPLLAGSAPLPTIKCYALGAVPPVQKGAAAAEDGAGDGVSVLEGGAGGATGMAATEDDYDREDSFLADSGEARSAYWFRFE